MNVLPRPTSDSTQRLPAVALGDVLDQRETDAAAAHLLLGPRRAAHEAIEDPPPLGRGNARAPDRSRGSRDPLPPRRTSMVTRLPSFAYLSALSSRFMSKSSSARSSNIADGRRRVDR